MIAEYGFGWNLYSFVLNMNVILNNSHLLSRIKIRFVLVMCNGSGSDIFSKISKNINFNSVIEILQSFKLPSFHNVRTRICVRYICDGMKPLLS